MQRKEQLRVAGLLLNFLLFMTATAVADEVVLTSGSTGYINTNPVKITATGDYTITGSDPAQSTENMITVELSNATDVATITIENINIKVKGCPFDIKKGIVNLKLKGKNALEGTGDWNDEESSWCAALQLAADSKLVITGEENGELTAKGGEAGAGIGGGYKGSGGTITIQSGTVKATGGRVAAGIGAGSTASGGTIIIEGGNVEATGGKYGAGIGGGYGDVNISGTGSGGTITIQGGTVKATGGQDGAGIGGGQNGSSGTISIEGGTVTATGDLSGTGIGCESGRSGGTITIKGGTVKAIGGQYSSFGIGGHYGSSSSGDDISIEAGQVTVNGGIGDSNNGSQGSVSISGGIIEASGSISVPTCTISGGTLVCKGVPSSSEITGGSVRTDEVFITKDGKRMAVIKGLPANTTVKSITIGDATLAEIKDLRTDASGLLFPYLPVGRLVSLSLTTEGGDTYNANNVTSPDVYDNNNPKKYASLVLKSESSGTNKPVLSRDLVGGTIELDGGGWNDTPEPGSPIKIKVKPALGVFLNLNKLKGITPDKVTVKFDGIDNKKLTYTLSFTMPSGDVCLSLFDRLSVTTTASGDDLYELTTNQLIIKKAGKYEVKGILGADVLSEEERKALQGNIRSLSEIATPISIVVADNISGMEQSGENRTKADESNAITIRLDGISLKAPERPGLSCGSGNNVILELDGENYLEAGSGAGINKGPDNGKLTIKGTGRVEAKGSYTCAGIGGNNNQQAKNITIEGGTISASPGSYAPGIGSGWSDPEVSAENISITGGSVSAQTVQGITGKKKTQITIPAAPGSKLLKSDLGNLSYNIVGLNLYPDSYSGKATLFLWLPDGTSDQTVTINGYTGSVSAGNTSPAELQGVEIGDGNTVSYDGNTHKDKSIVIKSGGSFTVNADDAAVIDLTIESGGKLLTTKALKVQNTFKVKRAVENKWTTFCSPVALTLDGSSWATSSMRDGLYLKTGYSAANDQKWTLTQSIEANKPYLLSYYTSGGTISLLAREVTLPAGEEITIDNTTDNLGNFLLFQANPSLTEKTLSNIYVLKDGDNGSQEVVLQTEPYDLQPFEAYFVASPIIQQQFKRFSLSGEGEPTGIPEVLKGDFHVSAANGTLLLDNHGQPGEVAVYNLAGDLLLRRPAFTGQERITHLPHGIYIVTYNRVGQKVVL